MCQFGHIMEGEIEVNDDMDDNFVPTRRLNLQVAENGQFIGTQTQHSQAPEQNKRKYGDDAKTLYLQCAQILLKKQISVVSELFGVDEESLAAQCKLYWLQLLSWTLPLSKRRKLPTNLDLVALIYLAATHINVVPVYSSTFLHHLTHNRIPYGQTMHLIPKELLDLLPTSYYMYLKPPRLPRDDEFVERIVRLAPIVGYENWPQPPYYYPYMFHLVSEVLLVPNACEVFVMSVKLAREVELNGPRIHHFPEIWLSCLVVFVLKLQLIFDVSDFPRVDWHTWLDALASHELASEVPFLRNPEVSDLLHASDEKVTRYCQWVYNNLVPRINKLVDNVDALRLEEDHGELLIMNKRLFQIFDVTLPETTPEPSSDPMMHVYKLASSQARRPANVNEVARVSEVVYERVSHHLRVSTRTLALGMSEFESHLKGYSHDHTNE